MAPHRRFLLVTLAALLALAGMSAPASAARRTPEACAAALDCPATEIDRMTMPERLTFVRAMSSGPAAEIVPGYTHRWRNIEGVVEFFESARLGAPGSWVSHVDSGILEGIERGIAIAAGKGTDTFDNPGSKLWASYLTRLSRGELRARSAHDKAWSEAEQASTERGVYLAEVIHGVPPTGVEERFFQFSEFYRATLRSRLPLLDPLSPGPGPGKQKQLTFLDWFTDVSNSVPSRRGCEMAYSLAEFDLPAGAVRTTALLAAYTKALFADFLADPQRS
ncbi:hypothetical protein [Amycolatopsis sp. CA-230715]|uniref:hypothetical protein n=1 Tax=Amycolatopsis sp. CA-230715 TaxID=2745196 RepID=UPI001C033361|nr:hypothetical protein [Amycolatopsis sp. CA-230715]QWF82600.1 hypothetical protein HUW46_06038 [Amycolatopsis sp. CA-230715]